MVLDPLTFVAGSAAIITGAFLQRIVGMGVGLVVGPALAFLLGAHIGVYATNIVTITSGLLLMVVRWKEIDWHRVAWIIPAAIPGAILGALVVGATSAGWLQIALGLTVLIALGIARFRAIYRPDSAPRRTVAGIIGGFLNTSVGIAAPAMVIYARSSGWKQPFFGASLQPIFFAMGVMSVAFKTIFDSVSAGGALPAWWYIPIAFAMVATGSLLGSLVAKKVTPAQGQVWAMILATCGALAVIIRGIISLS